MANNIDDLSLEIQANTSGAVNAIDSLVTRLERLSTALNGLNAKNLGDLSIGINNLTGAMKGLTVETKTADFTALGNNIKKLGDAGQGGGLTETSVGLLDLSSALESVSNANFDSTQLDRIVNAIGRLGNEKGNRATANLPKISDHLIQFGNSLNSMQGITFDTQSLSNIIYQINRLGGERATQSANNLPTISAQLQNLVRQLNSIGSLNFDASGLGAIAQAISVLGRSTSTRGISNLPQLTQNLYGLFNTLSKAPNVSQNIIDMTNALANLGANGVRVSTATRQLTSSFNSHAPSVAKLSKGYKGLASSIGMFYAKFFMVIRGFKALWQGINKSMDIVETYNYFDNVFKDLGKKAVKEMGEAGQESAYTYYKDFKDKSEQLMSKMTGFNMNDKGLLENTGMVNLGMSANDTMDFQAEFAQLSSSMGIASDYAVKMSNALTMLGSDLASIKNEEYVDTWNNMASGLVGMSKAVDKFGINIRNTALQEKLYDLGINVSIAKLGQLDKALLRSIIMIDTSRYAWGDLANTLDQPANQMRMLKANVQQLGAMIGSFFITPIKMALPYVNALVIALQRLMQYLANLMGIVISIPTQGAKDMGDLYDSIGDVGDGLDDASGKAKKLKQNLLGIDELNNITSNDDSGKASGLANVNADLLKAFDDIYDEYQKAWDKAYKNLENKAQKLADDLVSYFKNKDYEGLGKVISDWIYNGLTSIDWEKTYSVAKQFGKGFAEFLNGLFTPRTFEALGKTIAGLLNTVFYNVGAFIDTFDWKKAGISLASMLKGFTQDIDTKQLAHNISGAITGGLKLAKNFLTNAPWKEIGIKFGQFIKDLDWANILRGIWSVILGAMGGLLEGFSGIFDANPLAGIITTALASAMTYNKLIPVIEGLGKALVGNKALVSLGDYAIKLGKAIGLSIPEGMTTETILGGIGNSAKLIAGHFSTIFAGAIIGYKLGDIIAKAIYGEEWTLGNNLDSVIEYFTEDVQKAVATHPIAVGIIADYSNFGLADIEKQMTFDWNVPKFTNEFSDLSLQLQQALTSLGNYGVEMNNVAEVSEILGSNLNYLDERTKAYILSLAENYNSLDAQNRIMLEQEFGLKRVREGLTTQESALGATRDAVNQYALSMGASEEYVKRYCNGLDTATNSLMAHTQQTETAKRATDATKEAVAQYAEEQRKALGIVDEANTDYEIFLQTLDNTSISADEFAGYMETLSKTDMTVLSGQLEEFSHKITLFTDKLPELRENFEETFDFIKGTFEDITVETLPNFDSAFANSIENARLQTQSFIGWFKTDVEEMLTEDYWTNGLSGIEKGFSTAFTNASKAVITIINGMIDKINSAFKMTWNNFEFNGENIIDAGSQQLFQLSKIKGYELGGFPQKADLFYANENGVPELVGSMNGRTAVASGGEITGIKRAIEDGIRTVVNEMRDGMAVEVKVEADEDGIFKSTRRKAKTFKKSTGSDAFAF